jgi:sortase A
LVRNDRLDRLTSISLVCFLAGILTLGVALVTDRYLLGSNTQASSAMPMSTGPALPVPTPAPAESQDDAESETNPVMPTTLQIPRLDVDAIVQHVGYTDDGRMDAPTEWEDVAWFKYGYLPGAPGNSVMAGHLDSDTGPAIFAGLYLMEPGDHIYVTGEDGTELTFEVTEVETVLAEEAPLDRIFGQSDEPQLNLITCEGHFDPDEEDYDHRLIVYTTLVDS